MDLVELLQREIHDLKMQWSKLKEENVVLKGFKAMVMQQPKKYVKRKLITIGIGKKSMTKNISLDSKQKVKLI